MRLQMPLLWVPEFNLNFPLIDAEYGGSGRRAVPVHGQPVAFAPPAKSGDTTLPASVIRFLGSAAFGGSTPRMSSADVVLPGVQQLSPTPPMPIDYHPRYKAKGFGGADNEADIWARVLVAGEVTAEHSSDPLVPLPLLRFGTGGAASDRSGGFVAPSLPLRGVSRVIGAVGSVDDKTARLTVDPKTFFAGAAPKLFGLIDLSDLGVTVDSDLARIPKMISYFAGRIETLVEDIGRATEKLAKAVEEAQRIVAEKPGKPAEWAKQADDALAAAQSAHNSFKDVPKKLGDAFDKLKADGPSAQAKNAVKGFRDDVDKTAKELDDTAARLPLVMGNILRGVADVLRSAVGGSVDLAEEMYSYLNGLEEDGSILRVSFEWTPKLKSWPNATDPLLEVKEDSLLFSITARAGMNGKNEVSALAQMKDFTLHLFPKAELVRIAFNRFGFSAGSSKHDLDIVIKNIRFLGVLSFVEDLKELIPLDGFSDPPNIAVTPEGLTAGFGLALPDIAMGVFSITNMSLNADIQVPFLGKAVTVGFSFCTRERPFIIAVAFIGGGGWCGVRLSADGLEVLEVGLEAGAILAVNFGVASGSVSAMIGIYIRLEGKEGSLTAYFRLRGEVDVLGLISAAIELYLALAYHFDSGKLIGQATITVNVSVIGISKNVSIHTERSFAGSNGDPSFRDVMVEADGSSPAWTTYCLAFAEE